MNQRTRVCHLSSVHPVMDTRIFLRQCCGLARAGYEVELIAVHDREEVIRGVRIVPVRLPSGRLGRLLRSPLRMFFLARSRHATVYHFHDPELLITGILLRLFTRARVIYDIHEDYAKLMMEKKWLGPRWVRFIISRGFHLVEFLAVRFMSANVIVLPGWRRRYPRAVVVRNYPIPDETWTEGDRREFVYVGMIEPVRSGLAMLEIFNHLCRLRPDVRLTLVGRFDHGDYEKRFMEGVHRNPRIRFLGFRPFQEIRPLLRKAGFGFVLYSDVRYAENIPVKMFEYLAYCVIPVFSSFPGFHYAVEQEGWGIGVNPLRPDEAAERIHLLMQDEDELHRVQRRMEQYRKKYNWASEEERLLRLYSELTRR